jgi:NADPH2:quinone reductase
LKAIRFHEFGGPEVLKLEEVDDPKPGRGQVLVRVQAIGVNPTDISTRAGRGSYPANFAFPAMLGREASGVVEEVGAGVTSVKVGDKVIARGTDYSYAELTVVPEASTHHVPDGLGPVEAATVTITYTTAWDAVVNRAQVESGQYVLVQGASGGVGVAAVQIAKSRGATVIATASSDAKLAWAAEQGADHGVNYTEPDWPAKVKEITGGAGVDAVIDGVGGEMFVSSLGVLKPNGCIAVYGAAGGREVNLPLNQVFRIRARILGAGGYGSTHEDFDETLAMFTTGKLKATVERTWPLAEAGEAQRHVEERRVLGKVALTVGKR